jgi:hypothetical protein
MGKVPPCPGDGYKLVHSRSIRLKTGRVPRAEEYGLRCFSFWVKE